jgi:hypothetical protein
VVPDTSGYAFTQRMQRARVHRAGRLVSGEMQRDHVPVYGGTASGLPYPSGLEV